MAAQDVLSELAIDQANRNLGMGSVSRVQVDEAVDSGGEPAVRFRMIVRPGAIEDFDGDKLLDTLVAISRAVKGLGDLRRVILEYADQSELDALESH